MKWISLKEGFPKIGDAVLTYWNSGKYEVMWYHGNDGINWESKNGFFQNVYNDNKGIDMFECITHWKTLPNRPEDI